MTERSQQRLAEKKVPEKPAKPEAYRWRAQTEPEAAPEPLATPKALRTALEHEKTPELAAKLVVESLERDARAAEIDRLKIPKLVQQLALNAFKQQPEAGKICLHLRSSQRHLNSPSAQKTLAEALGELYGSPIELTVIEDDNPAERTPLEWRQAIYEESWRRRASPSLRIPIFRRCAGSSTRIWMKRVSAPLNAARGARP